MRNSLQLLRSWLCSRCLRSVAAHEAVSEALDDSGVAVWMMKAAWQILAPPAFVVAVVAGAVLIQQRSGFCLACSAQREPPAPTATEHRGALCRDGHGDLQCLGLGGMGGCNGWPLWNPANKAELFADFDYLAERQAILCKPSAVIYIELPDQIHEAVAAHAGLDCVEIAIPLPGNIYVPLARVDGSAAAFAVVRASRLDDVFTLE